MAKIVFFGTSLVAIPTLEILNKHHQVLAVVTTPDVAVGRKQVVTPSPVSVKGDELGLKVIKPEKVKGNDGLLEELRSLAADVFVVVSYGKILPKDLIDLPQHKTLNIHFSLLPKYRGAAPVQHALMAGETKIGTSIFVLDELLDHGPVVTTLEEDVHEDDTTPVLLERLAVKSANLLVDVLPDYLSGKLQSRPQDHDGATKAPSLSKEDGKIEWDRKALEIYNQWRALLPWPGVWTIWNGKVLKILDCVPSHDPLTSGTGLVPGTVLEGGLIICGDGTVLQILSLQLEGKTETDIASFLNGHKDFAGSVLV